MKYIDIIAGARPNFIKISPIIDALEEAQTQGSKLQYRLIHTGQHYDSAMSDNFFEQLGIPKPNVNLGAGSGSQAEQAGAIMLGYEKLLMDKISDLCLVVGDVTSTMACSVVARKLGVTVAHVEGGIRSGDWSMPEEINRVVTDSISNWFFTTSETANKNLRNTGVTKDRIFFVGNTMIDTLLKQEKNFRPPALWEELGLKAGQYFVLTLHRPSNVDGELKLTTLLRAVREGTGGLPVIFPMHPRTAKNLSELGLLDIGIHCVDPQSYLEFNYLVKHSKGVITDSGGITEETTVLNVPCITLRENTERPETVTIGTNELIGTLPKNITSALKRIINGKWKEGRIPEKWDGQASQRIVQIIQQL